jgi:hypothetical protein
MTNNLFISYDLYNPGQGYEDVAEAIKALGHWAKVQRSFWFVRSTDTAEQAAKRVWAAMDNNDSLIVVDASHNAAYWYNLTPEVSQYLKDWWRA